MERTLSDQLSHHRGKQVRVQGWLHTLRILGKVAFLVLRDRKGCCQVVFESKEDIDKLSKLQPGSILQVDGTVSPSSSQFLVEISLPTLEIHHGIFEAPPIEYYRPKIPSDLEYILDHRPLSLRNGEIQAVFQIQGELAHAFRLYMHDKVGAVEYFAPNLLGASSEGGAEFFHVDYFGHTATLAQSSQLYKQIMVGVNERVFAIQPFFRAEPSHTTRHLSEGKQFEFEMGFFAHWHEILDIQEECLKFLLSHLQTHAKTALQTLQAPLLDIPLSVPFPRLTFQEAQNLYFERTHIDERGEPDLSPAAERELCAWAKQVHGTCCVFVTDWKTEKRPFYAYPQEDNPKLTNTFDLLCNGTEITSGGQRRHTYASMVEGIEAKGMRIEDFPDYLSIFRFGMPPHGGFGMGLERLTMTLLGCKNIREVSLFPSDTKRIASNKIQAKLFLGAENIRNEILRLCKKEGFSIDYQVHAPTPTSQDSALVRKTKMEEGIKALILRGKKSQKNYQFNLPSHQKLDMKAVAALLGEKCEFEDPATILHRFGLEIGGIPPFGPLLGLETYFDNSIRNHTTSAFNCGFPTESIIMKTEDLLQLVEPKWGDYISITP